MNNIRVLRWSNLLLLLTGYQMHWFDRKSQTYRISLGWALNVLGLACTYVSCFTEHFQASTVLKVMQDASPFLYGLMRMQLFLGAKAFCYAIYASWRAVGVANELTESLPSSGVARRCSWPVEELVAYFLLLSTNFTLFFFCLYIGYEMNFELPSLQDAMIGTALFLPHLILAGSVRFYCTLAWITRTRLRQLKDQLDELLSQSLAKTELQLVGGTSLAVTAHAAPSGTDSMQCLSEQLQQLGTRFGACFDSLQRSLLLLLGLNGNGLLFGVYAHVYYNSTWHLLFTERNQRVFYASNALIFACIACDYLCLLLVQLCLERQVGPPAQEYIYSIKAFLSSHSLSLSVPLPLPAASAFPGQTELRIESELHPIEASTRHTQGHALHSMESISLQISFDLAF